MSKKTSSRIILLIILLLCSMGLLLFTGMNAKDTTIDNIAVWQYLVILVWMIVTIGFFIVLIMLVLSAIDKKIAKKKAKAEENDEKFVTDKDTDSKE